MKRITFILVALLMVATACEKLEGLTQFELEYDETVVVPSFTSINLPFNLFTPEIKSNTESVFALNDTRSDMIEEILLKELELTLTAPEAGDFSFLNAVAVYISAEGMEEVKIAWKDNIPAQVGQSLELETTDRDLKEFLKQEEITLRVSTATDELLTSDHHIALHSVFFVDARVLGL